MPWLQLRFPCIDSNIWLIQVFCRTTCFTWIPRFEDTVKTKTWIFFFSFWKTYSPTTPAHVLGKRLIPHVSYIEYAWLRASWWAWAVVSLPTNQPMVGESKLERKTAVPRAHLLETELLECVYLEDMESKLHKTTVKDWTQAQQLPEDIVRWQA